MFDPNVNLVNVMNANANSMVRDRPVAYTAYVAAQLLTMSAKCAVRDSVRRLAPVQVFRGSRKLYKVIKK
jgi:hypothetical protein